MFISMKSRVLIIAGVLAVVGCSARTAPGDAATAFIKDVAAGRQGDALERFDPQLRQVGGMMLGMALATETAKARKHGGVKDVRVVETAMTDVNHATVTTDTTYGDGTSICATGKVRQVDGAWFVTM